MTDSVSALQGDCPRCGEIARLRARTFSDQAMAALVAWQEISVQAIAAPICDECYGELREVLIDRQEELAGGAVPVSQAPVKAPKKAPEEPAPTRVATKSVKPSTGKDAGKKSTASKSGKKAG